MAAARAPASKPRSAGPSPVEPAPPVSPAPPASAGPAWATPMTPPPPGRDGLSPWDGVPVPFLVGAVGVGILALGQVILLVLTLSMAPTGSAGAYFLFATLGSVTLLVAFALGAALRSRLSDGVRTAFLIAAALTGGGGLGMMGLLFGMSGAFR